MTVLVCGATGNLGGAIAKTLLAKGEKVRALVREGSDAQGLIDAGAEIAKGDLKDPASLAKACEGVDTVITTANSVLRPDETVEGVDLKGNINLIDAAKNAGVKHFIFTSVLGVSEDSPMDLFAAKAKVEKYLKDSGMNWTVLSPNLFMDHWCNRVVGERVKAGEPVVIAGDGSQKHSFVAARDVCAYAVAAVGNESAKGDQIIIGGAAPATWKDVIAAFEAATGKSANVQWVEPNTEIGHLFPMEWMTLGAMTTYESPLDMSATSEKYGVKPTSIEDFAKQAS